MSKSEESGETGEPLAEIFRAWYAAFVAGARFEGLTEKQKHGARDVVSFFTEYSYEQLGLRPEEWTPHSVKECCLEVFPRKISAEAVFFEAVAPVLSAYFHHLDDRGLLKSARALAETVAPLGPRILAAGMDPDQWGPAKALGMGALREGVDLRDPAALEAYVGEYNERLVAKSRALPPRPANPPPASPPWQPPAPSRRTGPKVGRNDPCPCGSGKKHKKCCGS